MQPCGTSVYLEFKLQRLASRRSVRSRVVNFTITVKSYNVRKLCLHVALSEAARDIYRLLGRQNKTLDGNEPTCLESNVLMIVLI